MVLRAVQRPLGGGRRWAVRVLPRPAASNSWAPWCHGGAPRGPAPLGAGLCGCCQGLRLRAHGRPSPRRGGASVGLAREGGPAGRTGPGGQFGRGSLRRAGKGGLLTRVGGSASLWCTLCLQRGAPSGEVPLSLALLSVRGQGVPRALGGVGTPALHFLPAFPAGGLPLSEERGVRVDEDRVPVTGTTGPRGLRLRERARQPTGALE